MPEFPGGAAALKAYIANMTKYPEIAIKNGIQGTVYVSFVVSKTGKVTDAKIARGVDPSLNQEALRVVNSLPLWKPGVQRGVAVDVNYTVPVNFVLPQGASSKVGEMEATAVKKLTIVPNPAKDQVTITAEGMSEALKLDVNVFDRYGKQVKTEQKTGPTFTLSISDLITGTYYIQARNGNDQYVGSLQVLH
jgi:TonB family protein